MRSYEMNIYRESHAAALVIARGARLFSTVYSKGYGDTGFWQARAARSLDYAAAFRRALARLKTGKFSPC